MPKACDVKRGDIVAINQAPHVVEQLDISTPSARGSSSLYRFRFRNLATKQKVDQTLKGDDMLGACDFERRDVQFSYVNGDQYVFMDLENYSEHVFNKEDLDGAELYLYEDLEGVRVLVGDGKLLGIELPPVAEIEVTETDPSIRGASATARTKPATLSTGLIVQVPEYLETGEVVRVDTRTGKFLSRA
jgi:elongation factor P